MSFSYKSSNVNRVAGRIGYLNVIALLQCNIMHFFEYVLNASMEQPTELVENIPVCYRESVHFPWLFCLVFEINVLAGKHMCHGQVIRLMSSESHKRPNMHLYTKHVIRGNISLNCDAYQICEEAVFDSVHHRSSIALGFDRDVADNWIRRTTRGHSPSHWVSCFREVTDVLMKHPVHYKSPVALVFEREIPTAKRSQQPIYRRNDVKHARAITN